MKKIRVGINGLGRIGRLLFREILGSEVFDLVAANDIYSKELLPLLRYDSTHGRFEGEISIGESEAIVGDKRVQLFSFNDPASIKWSDLDLVFECTGLFLDSRAKEHLKNSKKVIISAPSSIFPNVVYSVNNQDSHGQDILSAASCTTNCLAPLLQAIDDNLKILSGFMSTVHSYTNDQNVQDAFHRKDMRRARAAFQNIIPTSTGATKAISRIMPHLEGKLLGVAYRVPTINGSLVDFNFRTEQSFTKESLHSLFNGLETISVTSDPVVSSDIIGMRYSSILDLSLTEVLNSHEGKVVIWYDNEMGYVSQLLRLGKYIFNS